MQINTWEARSGAGLTLKQLAELTGISKTTLDNIENRKTIPRIDQLEAIAAATGTKITDLFESAYK